ncbi:MAG TPA: hypothetical protein VGZ90_13680 [Puia sp.]|nr:hypothetical protein [Puia sp.]
MKHIIFFIRSAILLLALSFSLSCKAQSGCFVQVSCRQSITLPTDSATIFAQVASTGPYTSVWNFFSGPLTVTPVSPAALNTVVRNMDSPGVYIFSLTATNSSGSQSAKDTVIVNPPLKKHVVRVVTVYSDSSSIIQQ